MSSNTLVFILDPNHGKLNYSARIGLIPKPTVKSCFLKCLHQEKRLSGEKASVRYEHLQVNPTVVHGLAMVQIIEPKTVNTFREYSKVEIGEKLRSLIASVKQLDILLDVNQKGSRKRETQEE